MLLLEPQSKPGEPKALDVTPSEKGSQEFVEEIAAAPCTDVESPSVYLNTAEEARLYRKIDMRILPVLFVLEVFSFMDRGTLLV